MKRWWGRERGADQGSRWGSVASRWRCIKSPFHLHLMGIPAMVSAEGHKVRSYVTGSVCVLTSAAIMSWASIEWRWNPNSRFICLHPESMCDVKALDRLLSFCTCQQIIMNHGLILYVFVFWKGHNIIYIYITFHWTQCKHSLVLIQQQINPFAIPTSAVNWIRDLQDSGWFETFWYIELAHQGLVGFLRQAILQELCLNYFWFYYPFNQPDLISQ